MSPSRMLERRAGRTFLGVVLGLAVVGAGVGVGAIVWSGGAAGAGANGAPSSLRPVSNSASPGAGTGLPPWTVTAVADFSLGPGLAVDMSGGGAWPKSHCTAHETTSSFTTQVSPGQREYHLFQFTAWRDGTCSAEVSFSNFTVTVRVPGLGVVTGIMWLGQISAYEFLASCYSGTHLEVMEKKNFVWGPGITCSQKTGSDGRYVLTINRT